MSSIRSVFLAASCGLSVVGFSTIATAATIVDTELSLLVDVSGSVDSSEYSLQVDGYIDAFRNIDFTNTNFATNFVVWSGRDRQQEVVPWTQINDNASANAFADAIAAALLPETTNRPFFGGFTGVGVKQRNAKFTVASTLKALQEFGFSHQFLEMQKLLEP